MPVGSLGVAPAKAAIYRIFFDYVRSYRSFSDYLRNLPKN